MEEEFVDIYGNVGYFLRTNNLNTPGRISMLTSLIYLQTNSNSPVDFSDFYDLALEKTNEKLEKSSFKSFIKRLDEEIGKDDVILKEEKSSGTYFKCSNFLLKEIENSGLKFAEQFLN